MVSPPDRLLIDLPVALARRGDLWDPAHGPSAKLPWDDPGFSRRMLNEHLDQSHDRASRRRETVGLQAQWIDVEVLGSRPSRILDLGCGPGLHGEALAALGHDYLGIDIGPAAIDHARGLAVGSRSRCRYRLGDMTAGDPGGGHDLAMVLFGEFNTFPGPIAATLLRRLAASVAPAGRLLLEVHTEASILEAAAESRTWWASAGGLFADAPHVVLMESSWSPQHAATRAWYTVIVPEAARWEEHREDLFAYDRDGYLRLLTASGWGQVMFREGAPGFHDRDMLVIEARANPSAIPPLPSS